MDNVTILNTVHVELPVHIVVSLRRLAFLQAQKLELEIQRYTTALPGYLQDKDFISQLRALSEDETQILYACDLALKSKPH